MNGGDFEFSGFSVLRKGVVAIGPSGGFSVFASTPEPKFCVVCRPVIGFADGVSAFTIYASENGRVERTIQLISDILKLEDTKSGRKGYDFCLTLKDNVNKTVLCFKNQTEKNLWREAIEQGLNGEYVCCRLRICH
jgi:hypothetical protein